MNIKKNITSQNYNAGNVSRIKYIVIHYTGNDGDTALANTNYFKEYRGASAHYFVDEGNIYQSIEDKNIAWHCGAKSYKHSKCRNSNSIGIEICSRKNGNIFYFKDKAVDNAVWLTKTLMQKYNVPVENVIRHYDVTGKICPEPFVRDVKAWNNFKSRLITKVTEKEQPKPTIKEEDKCQIKKVNVNMFGKIREFDTIEKDGCNYIKLQDLNKCEELTVTYDKIKKLSSVNFNGDTMNLQVNGKDIKINRILKDGKNYIEIAGLRNADFIVNYNEKTKLVTLENALKELIIAVDNNSTTIESINIKGTNFCPLRSVASAVKNFDVDYINNIVTIKTKSL